MLLLTIVIGSVRQGRPLAVAVPVAALGAVVLGAALCVEGAARLTVTRPRPAASEHALMSDDAVTSHALRTAVAGVAALAYLSTTAMVLTSAENHGLPLLHLTLGLYLLTSFAWVACNLLSSLDSAARHYLVRLWGLPTWPPAPVQVVAGNPYRGVSGGPR